MKTKTILFSTLAAASLGGLAASVVLHAPEESVPSFVSQGPEASSRAVGPAPRVAREDVDRVEDGSGEETPEAIEAPVAKVVEEAGRARVGAPGMPGATSAPSTAPSFEALERMLANGSRPSLRARAATAMGEMGGPVAVLRLRRILEDEKDGIVRLRTAEALARAAGLDAAPDLARLARSDRSRHVRARAVDLLAQAGGEFGRFLLAEIAFDSRAPIDARYHAQVGLAAASR